MALITVMALALLVCAIAEQHLREALCALKDSLPNQRKRPTSRPTLRTPGSGSTLSPETLLGPPARFLTLPDLWVKSMASCRSVSVRDASTERLGPYVFSSIGQGGQGRARRSRRG